MTLAQARFQKWLGWLVFLPFNSWPVLYMTRVWGYKFPELARHRREYQQWMKDPRPLIICSNHLTYVDSILLIYAFGSHPWYWRHWRRLSWNLPAIEYAKNPLFRAVCFISKCIFIKRNISPRHQDRVLKLCQHFLKNGEPLTIFPEGRRSKTGHFDNRKLSYGVGKIISGLDECRVLCVYLRSDRQKEASSFPARDSVFHLQMEMMSLSGRGRSKEDQVTVTHEIGGVIARLERRHFGVDAAGAAGVAVDAEAQPRAGRPGQTCSGRSAPLS